MNFFDFAIFSSGIIIGVYLDQTYRLPNVVVITKNIWEHLKKYEPPKKEGASAMDIDTV